MSQRDLEIKSFGPFEIKSEAQGEVMAVVATLNVVDKDGDVILPGAVPPGGSKVKLSGFDHDTVLKSLPPVGRGMITEQGDKLVFEGKFFMSTERGREAFNYVREMGADGEWSFGFPRATKNATLTDEWRTKGAKRLIAGMAPFEASPVFVGAGFGTGTLLTKSADSEPETPAEPPAEPVAQADGDSAASEAVVETPAEAPAEPVVDPAVAEAEAKRLEQEAQLKAQRDEAMEEYHRVQRALRRMGYAA